MNTSYKPETAAEIAIAEYGKDNIFMVAEHYRGLYQDDYCSFTYYNNVTGEFFTDEWSTAYAAPSFGRFECMTFKEAFEKGLVNKEILFKTMKERCIKSFDNVCFNFYFKMREIATLGLRVEVNTGRKWRGTGYLIDYYTTSYQWDVKRWKSDNDYGTSTTGHAKIYDPATNRIETVISSHVKFLDEEKLKAEWKEEMLQKLELATPENLTSGLTIDFDYIPFDKWIMGKANNIDMSTAIDTVEEKKKEKADVAREKKLQDLITWVETNTDKKGQAAVELAEKIFKKKYIC